MENTNNNILETKNPYTYFYTNSGVIKPVDGVDIELREGSTLGVAGESGGGKSVTALSVMGLLTGIMGKVAGGEILLKGRGLIKLDDEEHRKVYREKTSIIFQEPMTSLNSTIETGDQIAECTLTYNSISRQEVWDKAVEMLKLAGVPRVEHMMEEYPFQLSEGQRQRVMMAMALVYRPKVLITDELIIALGVTIQAQILDLVENLKQKIRISILFTTRNLGVVTEVCDDVMVMYSGRVVKKGDVRSISANPSHPYTGGLLASAPKLGEYTEELESIPGNALNPKYMPWGRKFAPRCPCAFDKCREEGPGFYDAGGGHMSRCWFYEKEDDDA